MISNFASRSGAAFGGGVATCAAVGDLAILRYSLGHRSLAIPRYSVATTKDNLSSLIDKAMAGEEVIVTRHGKAVAEINRPRDATDAKQQKTDLYDRMRRNLDAMPTMTTSYLDLKRQDEADGAL